MHHHLSQLDHNFTLHPSSSSTAHAGHTFGHTQACGTNRIGLPIYFDSGQFAGSHIRAELRELQKAELGRKYARVDRRPLDPPPVVTLRLFRVLHYGTNNEFEQRITDINDIDTLGFICTVDLFPIRGLSCCPDSIYTSISGHKHPRSKASAHEIKDRTYFSSSNPQITTLDIPSCHTRILPYPERLSQDGHPFPKALPDNTLPSPDDDEIVGLVGNHTIRENSKMTKGLVGTTFVQASLVDWEGEKQVMFIFSDLAVKHEGVYVLRYRFFDISPRLVNFSPLNASPGFPVQAECLGGPFRVFSTKEFPGLPASTELTKHIARYGISMNMRETERKRSRRSINETPAAGSSSPKRRRTKDSLEDG